MRKKEEQKVVLPEYYEYDRMKQATQDRIKDKFSFYYDCGLDVMAKDFTGRRGRKVFLRLLQEIFIEQSSKAEITIKGLGNYIAEVVDVDVVKDNEYYRPVVKIMVISDYEEGNEALANQLDHSVHVYYKGGWGNCVIDAVDSIVGDMYDCMHTVFTNDHHDLPEDKQ